MTLTDIIERLTAEGYTNCHIVGNKQILLPGLGEVELAYGEARIFDAKYAWPGYGNHTCHKTIDDLFADINTTWPLSTTVVAEEEPVRDVSTYPLKVDKPLTEEILNTPYGLP